MKRIFCILAAALVVVCGANAAYAFFGSTDYTGMTVEKAAATIRKLDSQIQDVQIMPYEGKELPIITFRAGVVKSPLLEEADDMKDVTEAIITAKGAERFAGVYFILLVPAVAAKGNKADAIGAEMFWTMESLTGVNWKGFKGFQFLGLIEGFVPGPMGEDMVREYCSGGASYAQGFCRRIGAMR